MSARKSLSNLARRRLKSAKKHPSAHDFGWPTAPGRKTFFQSRRKNPLGSDAIYPLIF